MLAYYGYTISPNQLETVEGFLICRNVPIARTTAKVQYVFLVRLRGLKTFIICA